MYFSKTTLTNSYLKNPITLLTISSKKNMSEKLYLPQ